MKFHPLTFSERIDFYLGKELIKNPISNIETYKGVKTVTDLNPVKNLIYDKPLVNLIKKTKNSNKKFLCYLGDCSSYQNKAVLAKNRSYDNNDSVILKCLEFGRHWGHFYHKPREPSFKQKKNSVFWRGATTGNENSPGNRFCLVKKWFKKDSKINVGFSHICQGKIKYSQFNKGITSIHNFLNYKYIISVPGNDKDSGLNWKLNSKSVVMMPKPHITSWLMETTLVPNYHYVLIKDDFSDLREKLTWCQQNQDKCKKIIKNANRYMKQFKNKKTEKKLEREVINQYFTLIGQ